MNKELAATKIQSLFRGYSTRKIIQETRTEYDQLLATLEQKPDKNMLLMKKDFILAQLLWIEDQFLSRTKFNEQSSTEMYLH
jgi:hypothetical protein